MPNKMKNNASSGGFSLVEVMVATLILFLLIMMTGAVFRTSASAWDAGYAKSEGGSAVRTVVGAIQRELSMAVDGRMFGDIYDKNGNQTQYGVWKENDPVKVRSSSIEFIYYRDNISIVSNTNTDPSVFRKPAPVLVKYEVVDNEFQKTETTLICSGDTQNGINVVRWTEGYVNGPQPLMDFTKEFQHVKAGGVNVIFSNNRADNASNYNDLMRTQDEIDNAVFYPIKSVTIKIEIERSLDQSTYTVRSLGPNRRPDKDFTKEKDKDDIILVW